MKVSLQAAVTALLALASSTQAADRMEGVAILRGSCTVLALLKYDFTRACSGTLTNEIYRSGRIDFTFSGKTGSTVAFSGSARQVKQGPDVAIQPVDRVIWQFDRGVPSHVIPAVGKCRYTNPYAGKATVSCEATASEGAFRASFVTDGSPPSMREF